MNWQIKHSKLAAKDSVTCQFHQDTWDHYLMLEFGLAHIPWYIILNLMLQRSYKASRSELVFPSAPTINNIYWRDYSLMVDAIMNQLLSQNKVSLGLDGLTSTHKLAMTSVIAHNMDQNSALDETQLAFDNVVPLLFSFFRS